MIDFDYINHISQVEQFHVPATIPFVEHNVILNKWLFKKIKTNIFGFDFNQIRQNHFKQMNLIM